jgi:hypothetical protein
MVKEDLFFDELNVNYNYIIQKDSKYIVIVRAIIKRKFIYYFEK